MYTGERREQGRRPQAGLHGQSVTCTPRWGCRYRASICRLHPWRFCGCARANAANETAVCGRPHLSLKSIFHLLSPNFTNVSAGLDGVQADDS